MDWAIKSRRAVQCPRISDLYQAAVEASKTARSPEARALLRQVFPAIFRALELQEDHGWKPADFQRLEQVCRDRQYGRAPPPGQVPVERRGRYANSVRYLGHRERFIAEHCFGRSEVFPRKLLFRASKAFRFVFDEVVHSAMAAGLVNGEGFAVGASTVEANANPQRGVADARAVDWWA